MTTDELKRRLGLILVLEEDSDVDWAEVAQLSRELAAEYGPSLPTVAADYLGSFERRRLDPVIAHAQRSELVRFLRSSVQESDG